MASHGVPRQAQIVRKTDAGQIEAYKSLVKRVQDKVDAKDFTSEALFLTTDLLRQNPEYYTIWNHRRLVLQHAIEHAPGPDVADSSPSTIPSDLTPAQHEIMLILQEDLKFLLPLIKGLPKCYWIWNHRRWLLRQADEHLPVQYAKQFWVEEMALDSKMLSLDARNFHGWSYRREIVAALERCNRSLEHTDSVLESEFAYTTAMVKANLSNFSAWHNRSRLLGPLLNERKADASARRELIDQELTFMIEALYTDPVDQSLWFYHQCLIDIVANRESVLGDLLPEMSDSERVATLDAQLELIQDMAEDADDCKWIPESLLMYYKARQKLAGEGPADVGKLRPLIERLTKLDPLRRGRWDDIAEQCGLVL